MDYTSSYPAVSRLAYHFYACKEVYKAVSLVTVCALVRYLGISTYSWGRTSNPQEAIYPILHVQVWALNLTRIAKLMDYTFSGTM